MPPHKEPRYLRGTRKLVHLPSGGQMARHRTEEGQRMGRRLVELRERKGLTQEQTADLLDVSHRTLQNWEAGENIPRRRNREALAKLYGERDILAGPTPRVEQDIQLWRIETEINRQGEMLDALLDAVQTRWMIDLGAAAKRARRRDRGSTHVTDHPAQGSG